MWKVTHDLQRRQPAAIVVTLLPSDVQLEAAKAIITTITCVSQRSMEVHGIGMVVPEAPNLGLADR